MRASKNSARSRSSSARAGFLTGLALAATASLATWFFHSRDELLRYGDAQAHVNIARRLIDNRAPNAEQIGTVWLPLPHFLMAPFASQDSLWATGLAGAIPGGLCFLLAGLLWFGAARRLFDATPAGVAAALVFAFNPNLLYLQATPMTEPLMLASVATLLYACVRWRESHHGGWVALAGVASMAGSMTRYDGWFPIPLVALYFLAAGGPRRVRHTALYLVIAAAAPLWWLLHNAYFFGDPLEFYRGPWSARAIYNRSHPPGSTPFPGQGNWAMAWKYFATTVRLSAGVPLVALGAAGALVALFKRAVWPVVLLASPAVFYVLSLHGTGAEIHVPGLWPEAYYNTRYGLALYPLLVLGAGALVAVAPLRLRTAAAVLTVGAAVAPWLLYPRAANWVVWKEGQVNSIARHDWTEQAALYLTAHHRPGEGILAPFSDVSGIFCRARIPLRNVLHDGNHPAWDAAFARPDLFLFEEWVVAQDGTPTAAMMESLPRHANPRKPVYRCVKIIEVAHAPALRIYRRQP